LEITLSDELKEKQIQFFKKNSITDDGQELPLPESVFGTACFFIKSIDYFFQRLLTVCGERCPQAG